jgi:Prohead core protein serine protease
MAFENNVLLQDCVGYTTLNLTESVGGVLKFRGKFQEANAVNKNKRMYPFDVLHGNVDKLEETVTSRGLYGELDHPCLTDKNFRVLTVNGWKPFESIREGDYVYSNVDGQMVKSRVNAIIDEPYDGVAYKVKGRSISSTFSPGHRFLMNSRDKEHFYATIKEIHNNRDKYNKCSIPKTASWEGNNSEKFIIPGTRRRNDQLRYSTDLVLDTRLFASFLGLYLAEGNLKSNSNRIEISQVNESGKKLIRELLSQFPIKWKEFSKGFYTVDARLYDYLMPLGNKYNKYIPSEVKNLSSESLKELIHWFAIGDGRMLTSNDKGMITVKDELKLEHGSWSRTDIFSTSKTLIDDLHECLVKIGASGTLSTIISDKDYEFAGREIKAKNKKPLYQLHISTAKNIYLDRRFLHITEVNHTGRIYCLSTEYGNFYMEQDGHSFWTGNSDSIIHLANASHLITKLWWEGNVLMGEGEVLNTPSGKVLKSLIESGLRVGVSSRGVGNGQVNNEGVLVIGESYKLITFDMVADPSCQGTFQTKVSASKQKETYIPTQTESKKSIDTKALISFFGCLLEQRKDEVKQNRIHG